MFFLMVRVSPRPFQDLFETRFPNKMHFFHPTWTLKHPKFCSCSKSSLIISAKVWCLENWSRLQHCHKHWGYCQGGGGGGSYPVAGSLIEWDLTIDPVVSLMTGQQPYRIPGAALFAYDGELAGVGPLHVIPERQAADQHRTLRDVFFVGQIGQIPDLSTWCIQVDVVTWKMMSMSTTNEACGPISFLLITLSLPICFNIPLVTEFPAQSCIKFTHYYTTVCIHLQALFLNSFFIMKTSLEKDIFNEMIVAHEIPFHMIPKSMGLHIKWSG